MQQDSAHSINRGRRNLLALAAAAAMVPLSARLVRALDYPVRPVRIVVGFPAGGTPDIYARMIADWLSQHLGQPFVVENRPGASTNIGTELVVHADPDGYTLLLVASPNVINITLYPDLKFDFLRDIAPVACIGGSPFVMVVNPAFPAKTVPEFIAYAKANPGKINVASTGTGNLTHMAAELFKMMAGVDLLHVPYRGETAAQADLLSNRVQVMFDPIPSTIGYVRAGKLRALAISSAEPMGNLFPGLPTIGQYLPGYQVEGVVGIGAPAGTPADVIAILNKTTNEALADPEIRARFTDFGSKAQIMSPDEFGRLLAADTQKWAKVIAFAGIKPD